MVVFPKNKNKLKNVHMQSNYTNNVINIMLFYYLFTVFYQCFALKLRFKFGFY